MSGEASFARRVTPSAPRSPRQPSDRRFACPFLAELDVESSELGHLLADPCESLDHRLPNLIGDLDVLPRTSILTLASFRRVGARRGARRQGRAAGCRAAPQLASARVGERERHHSPGTRCPERAGTGAERGACRPDVIDEQGRTGTGPATHTRWIGEPLASSPPHLGPPAAPAQARSERNTRALRDGDALFRGVVTAPAPSPGPGRDRNHASGRSPAGTASSIAAEATRASVRRLPYLSPWTIRPGDARELPDHNREVDPGRPWLDDAACAAASSARHSAQSDELPRQAAPQAAHRGGATSEPS